MLATVISGGLSGLDAFLVQVEVEVRLGPSRFVVIGLGDAAVKESRDRVISAVEHSNFSVPEQVLVNLAPAERKKEGAAFDLAIAVGVLIASKQIQVAPPRTTALFGELALDGSVRAVRGSLALAAGAQENGITDIFVPIANLEEASLLGGVRVYGIESLAQMVGVLKGEEIPLVATTSSTRRIKPRTCTLDQVWGQEGAKRALKIAAAGGHNLLMIGPPGCGKSMMAERLPSILPPLTLEEKLETIKIHSVAGLNLNQVLAGIRPFRAPHHTISDAGLIGGGSSPKAGEITLAHNGVLFLDEFPEFRRSALEAMRGPLESRTVTVSRVKATISLPSSIQLIAAMNPCPCGRLGASSKGGASCRCSQAAIEKYLAKLSQPILDRIDLHIELDPVPLEVIFDSTRSKQNDPSTKTGEDSEATVAAVQTVRQKQLERQGCANAQISGDKLKTILQMPESATRLFKAAATSLGISSRGFVRIARVARTIADLDGSVRTEEEHVAEAIGYRSLDRLRSFIGGGGAGGREVAGNSRK